MENILKELIAEIKGIKEAINPNITWRHYQYRSEQINELADSLSKAQQEFKVADLNKVNTYFKNPYSDMTAIVSASRPALAKYGLSVVQDIITNDDGSNILHTILFHSSGQYLESRIRMLPPKNDIQAIYSYTNSLKRLAYSSLVGVVSIIEDDDGEAAVATERELYAKGTALNIKYNPKENGSYDSISKEQLEEINYELSNYPDIAQMILDNMQLQSLADLPKSKFLAAIKRVREIKQLRSTTK